MQTGLSGANCIEGPGLNGTSFEYNKFYPGVRCSEQSAHYVVWTVMGFIVSFAVGFVLPGYIMLLLHTAQKRVRFLTKDLAHTLEETQRMAKLGTVQEELKGGLANLRRGSEVVFKDPIAAAKAFKESWKESSANGREKLARRTARLSKDELQILRRYGWLYIKFKPEYRLFAIALTFFRRSLYIVVFVVVERLDDGVNDHRARSTALLIVSCIFLVVQTKMAPYLSSLDNAYSMFSFGVLCCVAGLMVVVNRISHELSSFPLDDSIANRRIEAAASLDFFATAVFSTLALWFAATLLIIMHFFLHQISTSYARTTKAILRDVFKFKMLDEVVRYNRAKKIIKEKISTGTYSIEKQGSFVIRTESREADSIKVDASSRLESVRGMGGTDTAIMHLSPRAACSPRGPNNGDTKAAVSRDAVVPDAAGKSSHELAQV